MFGEGDGQDHFSRTLNGSLMENINVLRIPIYKLYYIANVRTEKLINDSLWEGFERDYSLEERNKIISAVEWAVQNPQYDFSSLLPDLKHSNEDILYYLNELHNFFFKRKPEKKLVPLKMDEKMYDQLM